MAFRTSINGQNAEQQIRAALDAAGMRESSEAVEADTIDRYDGHVPDALLDIWSEIGLPELHGGRLRFCLPREANPIRDELLAGDADFSGDCHAIASTAFGGVFLWSERHWLCYFDTVQARLIAPFLHRPSLKTDPNAMFIDWFLKSNPLMSDLLTPEGEPLFEAVRGTLGDIPRALCYGFLPDPGDPRAWTVEAARKILLMDYLRIAIGTSEVRLGPPMDGGGDGRRVGVSTW